MADQILGAKNFVGKKNLEFTDAEAISTMIIEAFEAGKFDKATLIFNRFNSVMSQTVNELPLIPAAPPKANDNVPAEAYEIEPDDGTLLDRLLPRNLAVQIYAALLENAAGFYASQMTAMDNATKLSLNYNRARQANITRELIEIISGAEAL